ncbi:uncharacterized protein [Epargyreus clarus]|uniref:uncharacterized protein n=1 Tax=Epargyreus clarus TaxID=520877 RepID=UPI003C2F0EF2
MSFNPNWDVDKYKEEHESADQWELRRAFMIKWQNDYSEERLVCLARVFTNMEFMGCRYPVEVMQEIAMLSGDIAKEFRQKRKTRVQRTFVSASDAAGDYIRGTKRKSKDTNTSPSKTRKINFVPQCTNNKTNNTLSNENSGNISSDSDQNISDFEQPVTEQSDTQPIENKTIITPENDDAKVKNWKLFYAKQMSQVKCLDSRLFNEKMFDTEYGKFVLVIRPWIDVASNIMNSCISCKLLATQSYEDGVFTLTVNGKELARAEGTPKGAAKDSAYKIAWNYLRRNTVSLMLKEQWISQNDSRISMSDMSGKNEFGKPIEDSVALKMMKLMGWKGGGLGAESQGIAEPIKPNFRMVSRAGLGHEGGGLFALRRAGLALMKRRGDDLDADLVFTAEFTTEERAVLHHCAQQCGLLSKSYGGKGPDRFLVVTNKVHPFTLVRAVVQQGGDTLKYQVFIPAALAKIK